MTTYNTGNPVGSTDPKDLYDNAQNLDALVNSTTELSHADRLGVQRKTWHGMEVEFAQFLADSAYQDLGVYGAGIEVTRYNQVFLKDGEFYRAAASLGLPYTTTGLWASESGSFVGVGDAVLRQDLLDTAPGKGAALVGFKQAGVGAVARTVDDELREKPITPQQFGMAGTGVADSTSAFAAMIAKINASDCTVMIPPGTYFITADLPTITNPTKIAGYGRELTRLVFVGCNGLRFDFSGGAATYINTMIEDVSILTTSTNRVGVYFKGKQTFATHDHALVMRGVTVTGANVYDNTVSGAAEWATSVHLDDVDEVLLDDVFIRGSGNNSTFAGRTSAVLVKANTVTGLRITNSFFAMGAVGIELTGQSEGSICQGLTLVAVDKGFHYHSLMDPANNHVISNTHVNAYSVGVHIEKGTGAGAAHSGINYLDNVFILERDDVGKTSFVGFDLNVIRSCVTNCSAQSNPTTTTANRLALRISNSNNIVTGLVSRRQLTVLDVVDNGDGLVSYAYGSLATDSPTLVTGFAAGLVRSGVFTNTGQASFSQNAATYSFRTLSGAEMLWLNGEQSVFGRGRVSDNTYIDFQSKTGGGASWDARIMSSGGSTGSTNGQANLILNSATVLTEGNIRANVDNLRTCGTAAGRWSAVYAATGTIITSDARTKQQIRKLEESEKRVAKKLKGLLRAYKFNDAVETKGDAARTHIGIIAQDVKAAFESEGLDAEKYAILCFDEWEAKPGTVDAKGNVIERAQEAGNRYGVRYEELLAFIISAL